MARKDLRATMDEADFHRFKKVKSELEVDRNDEAIVELLDLYKRVKNTEELEEIINELQ